LSHGDGRRILRRYGGPDGHCTQGISNMRILLTTITGTGHFNPLVPYAKEMIRRGHDVRVAATDRMADRIADAGLDHAEVGSPTEADHTALFSKIEHLPPDERGRFVNAELFAGLLPRKALPVLQALVETWKPDLIVREAAEYGAAIVSALHDIPHARVSISNGHTFAQAIAPIDRLRAEYGLPADGGAALCDARAFSAFPASMEPANGDAATLPQFRVAPPAAPAAEAEPDWLSPGGCPRLYMTFGTAMGSSDQARKTFRAALDAVGRLEVTALMTTGPEMDVDALGKIPANVTLRSFVPQAEVFALVDAVLCHGGSGSVLGALAAGLPLVVTPIGADQPENAQAVAEVGAGRAIADADPNSIAAALTAVLAEPRYRAGAQAVAAEMAAHPDIRAAVDEMIACAA
jgi:UDP:flavonoid glycosyltransferase YjiC (YdhE family)